MKSHLFFIGIFLLGPSCKDSLTKYLLVEVDEPRIGNKAGSIFNYRFTHHQIKPSKLIQN